MLIASIDSLLPSPAPAREGVVVSAPRAPAAPAAYAAAAALPDASTPTPQAIKEAVTRSNEALRALSQSVEFEYDTEAQQMVIRVVDTNDRQVLRQVPAPEMLE